MGLVVCLAKIRTKTYLVWEADCFRIFRRLFFLGPRCVITSATETDAFSS